MGEAAVLPFLRLVLLWLAGIDLRLTLLAVPPVVPLIHRDLSLDEKAIGILTGMPTLLLGIAAVGGSLMIARIGARRALILGLLLVAAAGAVRGVGPSVPMLFGMTFLMAAGIAVSQPAAPTIVGEWFPASIGFATAVYVNGLLVGEAIGAALTLPVILPLVGSWGGALAAWSIVVALTAAALLAFTPHDPPATEQRARWLPDWSDPRTWQLGLLQGGISVVYFAANAYLPDYLHAIGKPGLVTPALAALNIGQVPSSLLTIFVAQRIAGRWDAFVAIGLISIAGMTAILVAPPSLMILSAGVLGFSTALSLVMIVALPAMLTEQSDVHRLSAGMFTIGYTVSFLGTLLGGAVWDATRIPATAFLPVGLGAIVVCVAGASLRVRPKRAARVS